MKNLILSVADITIAIIIEDPLESLVDPLSKLFLGYISKSDKAENFLKLSYDNTKTYRGLKKIPIRINENAFPELIDKIRETYPLSNNSVVVGFQNGCLAYNCLSNAGHLLFFHTNKSHFVMGTFHKLLFIFIALILSEHKKYMMHGAGIDDEGKGYLFLGESGAGKTTVAGFADKREVLSDDAPIVGEERGFVTMYPSPFGQVNLFTVKDEKHHEKRVLLKKMFFLKKNEELSVTVKDKRYAFAEIMKQHIHAFEFMRKDERGATFHFIHNLCKSIPAYVLNFQKNNQLWKAIEKIEISESLQLSSCCCEPNQAKAEKE